MLFGTVPFWCEPNCAVSIIPAKVFKLEGAFQILTALHASLEKTCILVAKDGAINLGNFFFYADNVAGQFTAAPLVCPGETFTFRCTVTGNKSGVTTWIVNGSSECNLVHRSNSSSFCGPSDRFTARSETGFGTSAPSFTSTLSGTVDPTMNGILVECFGPANNIDPGNRINGSNLEILGNFVTLNAKKWP